MRNSSAFPEPYRHQIQPSKRSASPIQTAVQRTAERVEIDLVLPMDQEEVDRQEDEDEQDEARPEERGRGDGGHLWFLIRAAF